MVCGNKYLSFDEPKKKRKYIYAGFYITIFIWMSQYKYSKNKN